MKSHFYGVVLGLFLTLFAGTAMAQGPAVSALNGKTEVFGGSVDGDGAIIGAGSVSVPLGDLLGLQLDGAWGELDGDDEISGMGLHLFARDPSRYLLGFNISHAELEDFEMRRYALEGEYYAGRFTLAALGGLQEGDVDDAGFGSLDLRWYPLDDLKLELGGSIADDDERVHLGAEYQVVAGLAVFVDGALGDDDYDHVLAGARYYFGAQKPLIRRHREDDPANNIVAGLLQSLGSISDAASSSRAAESSDGIIVPGGGLF
ncbi:hypothetical protein Pcar_0809 [Syntrophotalea carbinolica DSM 2380]|uniref:Outer membrane protein beta-barrel domain-containing protein n=1 Tax=Syntrophotalea carbinolica (strain DSM 2380 / NBRC 103641 / GraBd1) TaxID=338963 RepID=Q3A6E1_SYNC1|nr:hypothetical protein [Syntrophotalea carbinolica]ABA88066.1 hypothetical protein Pcar_0809 [Syntrophotalea carbinolica DSM 2380]